MKLLKNKCMKYLYTQKNFIYLQSQNADNNIYRKNIQ